VTGLPLSPDYVVPDGHFDEMRTGDGALREPWAAFGAATDLHAEHLSQAQKRVARQIDENGVTYNVYATADGQQRPWSLDVLPLIVTAAEWERLGRGLRQRPKELGDEFRQRGVMRLRVGFGSVDNVRLDVQGEFRHVCVILLRIT